MQMDYDFETARKGGATAGRLGGFAEPLSARGGLAADSLVPHPDWAALRARFVALHALRRSFAGAGAARMPAGNFMFAAEAVLASCRNDPLAVNFVCSGNGKDDSATINPVAGSPTPGDRGRQ